MQYIDVEQSKLVIAKQEIPVPECEECLIKVHAIGVNRADLLQRDGKYPPPKGESKILGLEICGEIIAKGSGVQSWDVGDLIFGLVAGGAYAEYAVIHATHMIPLPQRLSTVQGAAIAEVFLTAYQALIQLGRLSENQHVLIHAGASGIGTAAIQIAKQLNCFVVVTVSHIDKANECRRLGADQVIIHTEEDFSEVLKSQRATFNVILDVVAGEYVNKNISLCAMDAKIIILSMLGGRFCEHIDMAKMLLKRTHLIASTLRNQSSQYKAELVCSFIQQFYTAIENGEIKPVIDNVFHWHEAEHAHEVLRGNKNIGKVVLTLN